MRGALSLIGVDRAAKRNSFAEIKLDQASAAYQSLYDDPQAMVGVLRPTAITSRRGCSSTDFRSGSLQEGA
jgi:hypothetical protein